MIKHKPSPLVSVCIITYNHQKYISEAIESVLKQETSFEVEIIVGVDLCSDTTLETVNQYAKENKNIHILNTSNRLGMIQNWVRSLQACTGKYIAVLEGDDFWVSANKLQLQAEFLEKNTDFSLCFHPLTTFHEDATRDEQYLDQQFEKEVFDLKDVITKSWFIGTASMMFRTTHLPKFEPWVFKQKAIDKTIQLFLADKGKIKLISNLSGMYRIHDNGISQIQWLGKENTFHLSLINILTGFDQQTNGKYASIIDAQIITLYKNMLSVNYTFPITYMNLYKKLFGYKTLKTHSLKRWILIEYFPLKWNNLLKLYKS
ncbi:MAG: glycosyltransferase [Flavobacteriales bacterium]|nr:glycosyltransferase [Flavobacteriales bacterium]